MYTDSNNAAEYEALLHGLWMAVYMGIQHLEVRGDSNLAISQINGDFDANDPKMAAYRNAVLKMSARFEGLEFHGWLEQPLQKDVGGDCIAFCANACQDVCRLIVFPGYMVKFEPLEPS